jgi:hypothetical protein
MTTKPAPKALAETALEQARSRIDEKLAALRTALDGKFQTGPIDWRVVGDAVRLDALLGQVLETVLRETA